MENTISETKISPESRTSSEKQSQLLVPQDAEVQGTKEQGCDVQETITDFWGDEQESCNAHW